MPDHVHVLLTHADGGALMPAKDGFARWRNARRREHGPVWARPPAPEALPDEAHERRTVRYVHLNPCRAGLVRDPLEWPFSTHRDAVGLSATPVVPLRRDPERFHGYVSADPTAAITGTALPLRRYGPATLAEVEDAVGSVFRCTRAALSIRGAPRSLFLRVAMSMEAGSAEAVGAAVGVSRQAAWAAGRQGPPPSARAPDRAMRAALTVIGDRRFYLLPDGDLRQFPGWDRYRRRR